MEILPNEIITKILQYLPQKYLVVLSRVCKRWESIISQSVFFKTLDIYSITQLEQYINMANEIKINHLPMGHYVEHIHIHTDRFLKRKLLIKLVNTFPYLQSLRGLKTVTSLSSIIGDPIPPMKQLKHILFWYNHYDNQWMNLLLNNQHKIKTLEFMFKNKILVLNDNTYQSQHQHQHQHHHITTTTNISSPILYFSPISPLKIMPPEYSFTGSHKEYRIHNIFLPTLSSLTYLHINCLGNHGDEHMFESIHQSCPQLISLTLVSFYMHISNDYKLITNELLNPISSLKELSIGNLFYNSECYDFLSFLYPHLESLAIELATESYPETTSRTSRIAIYNMITQYKHLKKLKINAIYSNFPNKMWPLTELLEWLQKNPKQLTSLDHSYNFIGGLIDFNKNLNQLEHDINTGMIRSPLWNHPIFFQPHYYLTHLSYLSIGECTYIPAPKILCYFYLVNNNNINSPRILSNSINELKLDSIYIGNIYFWLKALPNLKSLLISGTTSGTQVNDNDNDDDDSYDFIDGPRNHYHLKEVYQYLKEKMNWDEKQQQQQKITDSTITTTTLNDHPYHHYQLKRFEIRNCNVNFKIYGWNTFFKRCPYLKTIIINKVNPIQSQIRNQPTRDPHQQVTFDLSHLSLDLLHIHHFNDATYIVKDYVDHFIKELLITETSLNKPSYYVGRENKHQHLPFQYEHSTTLNITCKYIDNLIFDQEF